MLRGFLTVGGWTMASRILGLVRDQLLAALMGAGPMQDAYQVAFRLPNLFRRLFGEGAFNAAFVPEFSGILAGDGPTEARRFAQEAIAVLAFWLAALTLLGLLLMPQAMRLLAPGFADVPGKAALTVTLARIMFPYLFLICLAALLSGVLNGLDRFAAAAAAPETSVRRRKGGWRAKGNSTNRRRANAWDRGLFHLGQPSPCTHRRAA